MARPAGANADQTRAKVREAAAQLFAWHGVGGTSVKAVADACGVTPATVHHYFGGKQDLHRSVVEFMYEELERLQQDLAPALAAAALEGSRGSKGGEGSESSTGSERILGVVELAVRRLFRFAIDHDHTVRMLLRNAIESGQLDPDRRRDVHLPFLSEMAMAIEHVCGLPPARSRLAIQSVMHLIVRYALTDPHELGLVAEVPTEEAVQTVEDHLVVAARALLGV